MKTFNTSSTVTIGKFTFTQLEDIEWNNHKYSKAWHRQYGGVKEVSNRRIVITKQDGRAKGGFKQVSVVLFDAWRGNILVQAIDQSGVFKFPETKVPLSVRLNKWYDAKITRTVGHVRIYERTLLGEFVDYCAVLNGVTFHAPTIREAVKGLNRKIKAAAKRRNQPITYKLCKELGFCDAGIKEFCAEFNLDIKESYSPSEIEALVKAEPAKAAPFENELRTVAKTLGYQTSI